MGSLLCEVEYINANHVIVFVLISWIKCAGISSSLIFCTSYTIQTIDSRSLDWFNMFVMFFFLLNRFKLCIETGQGYVSFLYKRYRRWEMMRFLHILFTRLRQKAMTSSALMYSTSRWWDSTSKKPGNSVPVPLLPCNLSKLEVGRKQWFFTTASCVSAA